MELSTINNAINEIKTYDIHGCVTGSCLMAYDSPIPVELWTTETDIDIFTYTQTAWTSAVQTLLDHGYRFGEHGKGKKSAQANEVKWNRHRHDIKQNMWLDTIKLYKPEGQITINISAKKDQHNIIDVLGGFDATAVMQGIDLPTDKLIDLRETFGYDKHTAAPNPIRWGTITEDASSWKASTMMRQWTRVEKMFSRGIDTLPLAEAYKEMLTSLIETGNLFEGEDAALRFETFNTVYKPVLENNIIPWIKEHSDE